MNQEQLEPDESVDTKHDNAGSSVEKTNLIVNYLPQSLTDSEFYQLFISVGPVTSARIIRDKQSGYSFGYGFVDYENTEDAARAITELNKKQLYNKTIKVDYSKPSGTQTKNINLYVSGLPKDVTEDSLRNKFMPYGTIVQVRLILDKVTSKAQGIGFVLYSSRNEAVSAIENLNGTAFSEGCMTLLTVRFAKTQQKPPPGSSINMNNQHNQFYGPNYKFWADIQQSGVGPMRGPVYGRASRGGRGRYSPMATNYVGNNPQGVNEFDNSTPDGAASVQGSPTVVYVYGIGPYTSEQMLWELFNSCGNITKVNVIFDQIRGIGKGYGFVTFATQQEAYNAVACMNNFLYQGKALQVSIKT